MHYWKLDRAQGINMDVEQKALALTEHIYDAVMAPEKWQQLLDKFVSIMGANSALLREVNYDQRKVGLFSAIGYDPAMQQAYRDYYVHKDIFATALKNSSAGQIISSHTAVPWAQQLKSEFYNDYMRPIGGHYVLGATLAKDTQRHLLLGIQKSERQGDFTEQDLTLIKLIVPHITRAAHIHQHLYQVTSQKQWALAALNQLKTGVILLNEQGHPLFVNPAALRTMDDAKYIIADDGLLLGNVADTLHLHRLINHAANFANGRGSVPGGTLVIDTTAHQIRVQVIPLPRDLSAQPEGLGVSTTCVAVFISSNQHNSLQQHTIIARYGFTPAEARLAILLAQGMDLNSVAKQLSVSVQTVRSQLKAIFAKANVSRQAELVTLLLSDMLLDCTLNADVQSGARYFYKPVYPK